MASLQEARKDLNEAMERMAEEDESAWAYNYQNQNRHKGEQETDRTGGSILDSAMEKAGEVKDKVKGEMERGKEKVRETKDEAKEKSRELMEENKGRDQSGNREKLEAYKESAAEAGRKAREYLKEAKEETRVKLAGETKARLGETEESARKNLEDVRQRAAQKAEEAQHKSLIEPDEKEKGRSASDSIYGSFPNVTEQIKEKMTMPNEIVVHKRGDLKSHEIGGNKSRERKQEREEDPMLRAKDADQMTGTGFIDVGKMGEEGTGFVGRNKRD